MLDIVEFDLDMLMQGIVKMRLVTRLEVHQLIVIEQSNLRQSANSLGWCRSLGHRAENLGAKLRKKNDICKYFYYFVSITQKSAVFLPILIKSPNGYRKVRRNIAEEFGDVIVML